jgi:hypothetical protein
LVASHIVSKETSNLTTFGAIEYIDGALTLPPLKEHLLRGTPSRARGQSLRGCGRVVEYVHDWKVEDIARRRECKELEAIELTGCVSAVFVDALIYRLCGYPYAPADLGIRF